MGGQTALNLAKEVDELGIWEEYKVRLIGVDIKAINKAEDRAAPLSEAELSRSQLANSSLNSVNCANTMNPLRTRPVEASFAERAESSRCTRNWSVPCVASVRATPPRIPAQKVYTRVGSVDCCDTRAAERPSAASSSACRSSARKWLKASIRFVNAAATTASNCLWHGLCC